MSKKILLPLDRVAEGGEAEVDKNSFDNPVLQKKPISIETALIFGEHDRFYNVINPDKFDKDNLELDQCP